MKCPKCQYLGFDTGDRCRNCGYNFSFAKTAGAFLADDVPLHHSQGATAVVDHVADVPLAPALTDLTPRASSVRSVLPLFTTDPTDDSPLVRLPARPRPPLAVRKTPEIPRIKVASAPRRREPRVEAPQLDLQAAVEPETTRHTTRQTPRQPTTPSPRRADAWEAAPACAVSARLSAIAVDLGILFAVDLAVLYFTLRIAALTAGEWRLLPPVPFVLFLLLLKVLYYWAFTTVGGQTIGKMAMRIRVVADEGAAVAPARAFSRTLTATASLLTLGAPFLAALFGTDRRAVHDRLAHTRVVTLPGA
jgi:uncharacterized RDD family membrane protein YckC